MMCSCASYRIPPIAEGLCLRFVLASMDVPEGDRRNETKREAHLIRGISRNTLPAGPDGVLSGMFKQGLLI